MPQLINAVGISKSFAGRDLFSNLSLGVQTGDRIGLVGPNGAGKSTLFNILSKQLEPDSGQVVYQRGLRTGYLRQNPSLASEKTLEDLLLSDPDTSSQAYVWISRLHLDRFDLATSFGALSGGWQKRVALALELSKEPDVLLLDEPTNHLDVSSIIWLEEFLNETNLTYVMITHDRLFLQRTAAMIWDLDPRIPQGLLKVPGDYGQFLEAKEVLVASQKRSLQTQKNTLRRETEWLRRGAQARQTKQKARILAAGELTQSVNQLKDLTRSRDINLDFSSSGHKDQKLMELEQVKISFGEKILWENLNLRLTPKSRVALLGNNGTGKSSLLKLLVGELEPSSGRVKRLQGLTVNYFDQTKIQVEERLSALRNVCPEGDYVDCQGEYIFAKSYLERFNFSYQQMDIPVSRLSGGERSRLLLAKLMLKKAQLLILDEPTNDLDLETLETLQESLRSYQGAVVLVTHDRYFMDSVAKEILALNDEFEDEPRFLRFADYYQWENWYNLKQEESLRKQKTELQTSVKEPAPKASAKISQKEKFELERMEHEVQALEEKLMIARKNLEDPEILKDGRKSSEVYKEISSLEESLEKKFERWSELETKLKGTSTV